MFTKDMYPAEIAFNKADSYNELCSFLDSDIYIVNGKLNTQKSFPIVKYPLLSADAPF